MKKIGWRWDGSIRAKSPAATKREPDPWEVISPSSREFKAAEKRMGFHAVGMVGYRQAVPRQFGDNQGAWPVKVVSGKDLDEIVRKTNAEQPLHECIVHGFVWVRADAFAKLLKAALDDMLLGVSEASQLRMAWRDCPEPTVCWNVLLAEAVKLLGNLETISESDRVAEIQRKVWEGAL